MSSSNKIDNLKIDLVYTWCDGNDIKFKNKKLKAMGLDINKTSEVNGDHHIIQADELLYSLRSVQQNIPWINKIYIIVDDQKPNFLNFKSDKIKLVDLKEIFPADALPNFNTNAIEAVMGRIKGLSEYFILASDDMMVNKPLEKSYFYNEDGKPIIYTLKVFGGKIRNHYDSMTYIANFEANGQVTKKCYQDCHNMTPHCKSDYNWVIEKSKYKKDFDATIHGQFRNYFAIQRFFIYLLLRKQNKVEFKYVGGLVSVKHFRAQLCCENRSKWLVGFFRPSLFCINASKRQNIKENNKIKKFLNKKFPVKSEFEK